jgi:hypothetical protein
MAKRASSKTLGFKKATLKPFVFVIDHKQFKKIDIQNTVENYITEVIDETYSEVTSFNVVFSDKLNFWIVSGVGKERK